MIKIALTGGIGAGKTTISKIFEQFGVSVFNSDKCARDAEKIPHIQEQYKKVLGDDIFVDGIMDRPKMREIVFNDKTKLSQLNEFMIPYVSKCFLDLCEEHIDEPYIILESAIIFENGLNNKFDCTISVIADEELRIKRVIERDGLSFDEVKKKLSNQLSDSERIKLSDFIIYNNGSGIAYETALLKGEIINVLKLAGR